MEKTFQDCSLPVKIWRLRHYLWIPFEAAHCWVRSVEQGTETPEDFRHPCFRTCWNIALGMAQYRMNWVFRPEWDNQGWDSSPESDPQNDPKEP